MTLLADLPWKVRYSREDGDLVRLFYIPALACAVRYDRTTGYFSAKALALAARGLEGLVRNDGRMRLIVGCTLDPPEIEAIERGMSLREAVAARLGSMPLVPPDAAAGAALELLAWMVARGILEVKVAVPCNAARRPIAGSAIFHEKSGIIEDRVGDRIAFNGSLNESAAGWTLNWESFHVYTSWGGAGAHVEAEELSFHDLWVGESKRALVIDVPTALREELLRFLPKEQELPHRLIPPPGTKPAVIVEPPIPPFDPRRIVWNFIWHAAALPEGGERVGEATSAVTPWPHQIRAFQRLYGRWPPRLLIADEVGLGKTIQAGLLLRQAWLAGRARRILIMAPKAVLRQWQVELREKFNLNWPIYDGARLTWYPSPALFEANVREVGRDAWHREPCLIVSSHLLRRRDRAAELLEQAEPWDLVVLDEAHHARRRTGGLGSDERPNQLLRLMRQLRHRTHGLVLLTATPMQVSAVEIWDLLALLGLPSEWQVQPFLTFFNTARQQAPSHEALASMARLFQAIERDYGEVDLEQAERLLPDVSRLRLRRVLRALRDESSIPLRQLEADERRAAVKLMLANTPVRRLVSRHTRELLRRYHRAGKLTTRIAERAVEDRFVELTPAEREVYEAVEEYIATTYNRAAGERRKAVGFVMTVYRRRLASSFRALACTLTKRLSKVTALGLPIISDEDVPEDAAVDEALDADDAAVLEREARLIEEGGEIQGLLRAVERLDVDTKATVLNQVLGELRSAGYRQAIVFTQYTDTIDFLREQLVIDGAILCFSGRGGEVRDSDGRWCVITREETKRRFREGGAEIMLCTSAAAEGLNFQFCGALVNYDLPWNPMQVEQRIGRIDRLGQEHPTIRIVNLHYEDTVETDVYLALRRRIGLFQTFVGRLQPILARVPRVIEEATLRPAAENRLQPILARVPRVIEEATLRPAAERDRLRAELEARLEADIGEAESEGLDVDALAEAELESPPRPPAPCDLEDLHQILDQPHLLPAGTEAKPLGGKDFAYLQPGMPHPVRITTDPEFFDAHSDSSELWSPGSPLFPKPEWVGDASAPALAQFRRALPE